MPLDLNFFADNGDYDNALTLSLRARQPGVNAAPAPVWFECETVNGAQATGPLNGQVYDPQSHRIIYLWNFGDPDSESPSTALVLNMPAEWKDLNCAYGRKVAHVYKAGRVEPYTVTCYAYEPETKRFGSETITVQISEADEVFADGATIIYDPSGTAETSAYPNANVVTTNWAAVKGARSAVSGYARILVAPGVELSEQLFSDDGRDNIRIGPLDPSGSKFILNEPSPGAFGFTETIIHDADERTSELVIYGARFQGPWDSTTETGKALNPFFHSKFNQGAPNGEYSVLLSECEFDGWAMVNPPRVSGTDVALQVIHECSITNWQNYGAQGSTTRRSAAFLGCSIFQNPDALSGGAKNQLYNNHGAIRDFGHSDEALIVSSCDLFSRNGWFPGAGGTDLQPALRLNTNGVPGAQAIIDRVCAEGPIDLTEQNSTRVDVAMNAVFDKLLTIRGAKGMFEVMNLTYGGVTVRNWFAVQLGAPVAARNIGNFVHIDSRDTDAEGLASPVEFYNVTGLDLRSDTQAAGANFDLYSETAGADGPFQNLTIENNVLHQPNRTGVTNASAPIDLSVSLAGVVSRDKGPRFNFLHTGGTGVALGVDIPDGASLPEIPYSEIRDTLYNGTFTNDGTPTDLAYWQANLGGRSLINIHTSGYGTVATDHAERGEITVTLSATGITITNTSGTTWAGDRFWSLRLDRAAVIPAFDPAFSTQGTVIPVARPVGNSLALTNGNADVFAYDDFLGRSPRSGLQSGAIFVTPD